MEFAIIMYSFNNGSVTNPTRMQQNNQRFAIEIQMGYRCANDSTEFYSIYHIFYYTDFHYTLNLVTELFLLHFTAGTAVVPGTDYAYSTAYSQYGAAYGTYGYGTTSSGLLSK